MVDVNDVWVCLGGCGTRQVGKPEGPHDCHHGKNGWSCHSDHDDRCDLPMCATTAEWIEAESA